MNIFRRQRILDWLKDGFVGDKHNNPTIIPWTGAHEGIAFLIYKTGDDELLSQAKQAYPFLENKFQKLQENGVAREGLTPDEREYVKDFLSCAFLGYSREERANMPDKTIDDMQYFNKRYFKFDARQEGKFLKGFGTLLAENGDAEINYEFFKEAMYVPKTKAGYSIKNFGVLEQNFEAVFESQSENALKYQIVLACLPCIEVEEYVEKVEKDFGVVESNRLKKFAQNFGENKQG